uniref:Uncharacterized protein n=1 Tax=Quercus lobata TaxID=97700 RepID=A0A7N2LC99_QUELO
MAGKINIEDRRVPIDSLYAICGQVEEAVYHALWERPLATNVWAMVKGKLQKCAAILQNFHLLARQMKGKLTGNKMEIWVIVA